MSPTLTRRPAGRAARARTGLLLSLPVTLALTLSGCSGIGGQAEASAQPSLAAPSTAPVPVASAPRIAAESKVNYLTGEEVPDSPVLAVKIDNTPSAMPQAGLQAADVVYVEEVESGVTRLLSVFQTEIPSQVGPIRSARTSDIEILGSYGPVGFAVSGGNSGVIQQVRDSPLQLLSMDASTSGFTRAAGRRAPYDVLGDGPALLSQVPGAATARDVGFRFGDPPAGGQPVSGASYSWPGAAIDFEYSADTGTWLQSMGGRPGQAAEGGRLAADTVVFQAVPVVPSAYVDVTGARSPEVRPVGEGAVTVLRDGQAYTGTWSRPSTTEPTAFTAADGSELTFRPGQTWVVYMESGDAPELR